MLANYAAPVRESSAVVVVRAREWVFTFANIVANRPFRQADAKPEHWRRLVASSAFVSCKLLLPL